MRKSLYFVAGLVVGALATVLAAESSQDPVKLSPQYYAVRFENDRVRVLECHLKPGQKEVMHSHPPGVVYTLADATLRISLPDGTSEDHPSTAGQVSWRDWTTHAAENVGQTEAHVLAIELKK
jgi:hypothetical protein